VAAKPKSAVFGFLVGGMVWFAVPFCMATTNGLAGRAITTHPSYSSLYIDDGASGSGLTPARVLSAILGQGGAFILLLQLFMAITSTGSAEIIAVSSILTYDIFYTYIQPELKDQRENRKKLFYKVANNQEMFTLDELQGVLDKLVVAKFFTSTPSDGDVIRLVAAINSATKAHNPTGKAGDSVLSINVKDLYDAVNRSVSGESLEGTILLRVSKACTLIFALFMGFLAILLQELGLNLGFVYMSMGVLIGSAVGPASLAILYEKANGLGIAAGCIGGLFLGLLAWCLRAQTEFGEVTGPGSKSGTNTLGKDWPFVFGNVFAICGGGIIAILGSLIKPDNEFKWPMLNERIPLVDDIEPVKDEAETEKKLYLHYKMAVGASVALTFILIIAWPFPMMFGLGAFGKGRFTSWVVVEIMWACIGGVVIIGLPAYETVKDFMAEKKVKKVGGKKLKNGALITVNVEEAKSPVLEETMQC